MAAALLLLAAAAPRAGAAATRLRALTPAAETAGGAGADAGAAGPPAGDPAVAAKLLSSTSLSSYSLASLSDAVVLAFRNSYKDLGVSMGQLMDAETAGNLAEYEATFNEQRILSLSMVSTIAQYRTIMQSLHTSGRCLDFGRRELQPATAATRPRAVPTTGRQDTVVPCFFEDQYTELEPTADDAWTAWCKEFLFFGAGCVEFCCTAEMAGSAVCNTADDPDRCT
ncbi:hypothetical protein I4F81_004843 [Pyropia yezoensis]|uniref:Uncharacterized protein n=1 Tax=Pyropia yezoensis TaxID=2788 RepID=A0ACC3BX38_PYRYE|nr:hypothetical protein I4F81_004843 [Neopyropia yezoensis]